MRPLLEGIRYAGARWFAQAVEPKRLRPFWGPHEERQVIWFDTADVQTDWAARLGWAVA